PARMDLVPEAGHLAEAVLLIVVVVTQRPGLNRIVLEQRLENAVVVRNRAEAETDSIARVHAAGTHLVKVGRRAEVELLAFVEQRLHDFRILSAEFQAVDSFLSGETHPLACDLGRLYGRIVPALSGERTMVGENARRGDLVLRATLALAQSPIHVTGGN